MNQALRLQQLLNNNYHRINIRRDKRCMKNNEIPCESIKALNTNRSYVFKELPMFNY